MGLFNFNKKTNKKSNNTITKYENVETLPEDTNELEDMFHYYFNKRDDASREIAYKIVTKAHQIFKEQTPYNKFNWARSRYIYFSDDFTEYGAYEFDTFVKELNECYLDKKDYNRRNQPLYPWDFVGTKYHQKYGRNFTYHNDLELTKDMKRENAVIEYFESHIPELINSIFELYNKELETNSLLHTSYYLYEDLFDYIYNSNERYSFDIWEKTKKYMTYAHIVHTYSTKEKKDYQPDITSYDIYTQTAINAQHNCIKEKILNAYYDNKYYKDEILPFITQGVEKLHASHQLETALSHILNMNQNSILSLRKKASIGDFLYAYHNKYTEDEHDIIDSINLMKALKESYISYDERNSSVVSSRINSLQSLYMDLEIEKELEKDFEQFMNDLMEEDTHDDHVKQDKTSISLEVGPMVTLHLTCENMLEWFDQATKTYKITNITLEDPNGHIYNLLNKEDVMKFADTTHSQGIITITGRDRLTAASNLVYELFLKGVIGMSTYAKCLGIINNTKNKVIFIR